MVGAGWEDGTRPQASVVDRRVCPRSGRGSVTWATGEDTAHREAGQLPAPSWAPPVPGGLQGPVLSAPPPGPCRQGLPQGLPPALPSLCAVVGSPSHCLVLTLRSFRGSYRLLFDQNSGL